MTSSNLLKNSTALAMVLALGLTSPASLAFAQDSGGETVNCETDPDNPACVTAPEAPAEQPTLPAAEAPAPEAPANEAPPAEPPAPEAPAAPEPAPQPPAIEAPAPAPEQPAEEAVQPDAAQEPAPEQPAAEQAQPEPAPQPAAQEPAPEAPAAEQVQPEQPGAQKRAPRKPAAEAPAPEAPAAEQPQPEQPKAQEAAPRQPTQAEQPAAEESQAEPPARAERRQRDNAEQRDGRRPDRNRADNEEAPVVIPDNATKAEREQVEQEQLRNREDARKNRGELLGAAAIGAVIGALVPALGGRVVEDEGDRIIVERDGEYYVRKDESSLLRQGDAEITVQRLRGGRTLETVARQNGVRIETVRDAGGYILKRSRILPNGREYVLIDNRDRDDRRRVDYNRQLPPLRVDIARERYIVPARRATRQEIFETISAPPVERVENAYTLREVRENERLRDKMRRVDLDTITFETGSAVVREGQVPLLEDMARAMLALVDENPSAVILVEGHTDAVGSETYNLALSDRRAETVARILVERYGIPPENLVVQGYGEQFLKVETQQAEAQNRRATIRNITPLLAAGNQ